MFEMFWVWNFIMVKIPARNGFCSHVIRLEINKNDEREVTLAENMRR